MKSLKITGISLAQSFLFTLLTCVIISNFFPYPDIVSEKAAAIGIIGGADGPTTVFLSMKSFSGNILALTFCIIGILALISNLSALVQGIVLSRTIFILCNLLMLAYCYLFLHYGIIILVLTMLMGITILTMGYMVIRSASDWL